MAKKKSIETATNDAVVNEVEHQEPIVGVEQLELEPIGESDTVARSFSIDLEEENRLAKQDAIESGLLSTKIDSARGKLLMGRNKGFITHMELRNPKLVSLKNSGFRNISRAAYTEEEKEYFMRNNFDWFQVNGTCYEDFGKQLGSSGVYLPTGYNKWAVCTIEQFVEVILREIDVNRGRHQASYEDTDSKYPRRAYWYKRDITKYNVDKFIIDYCEGKIARMDGVGSLPSSVKEGLLAMVEESKK